MVIRKCDRCGAEELEPILSHKTEYPKIDTFWIDYDEKTCVNIYLCPECTKKVINFVTSDEFQKTLEVERYEAKD